MIRIGTSGYQYPEWKGSFYPEKLSTAKMLPYYAERFSTVEINYTFYRFPSENVLLGWAEATPEGFQFTLKAPKRITHDARLRDCGERVQAFTRVAGALGDKLGILFFQLPPNLKLDLPLLADFLATLPPGARAAFEFRHASWHDDAVYGALQASNAALCIADSEKMSTPIVMTADFGYFRLRDEGYDAAALDKWAEIIQKQAPAETYVYFKHEDTGKGAEFGQQLQARLSGRGG